jgi:hypothetical protein
MNLTAGGDRAAANDMTRHHLVAVWNPLYQADAMEAHLAVLLEWMRKYRAGACGESDVYVWWGRIRSPRRVEDLGHLDQVFAIETERSRDDPARETHLYLTDYRSLYVAHLGDITDEDPRTDEAAHVPAFYAAERVQCDCWFLLWDIQRLVADDLVSVAQELRKLRNVRYHDQPVSIYGGMVDLPLIVADPTEARYFDPRVRRYVTDGKFWAEFDAERSGLGAMERELRENMIGEEAWRGLDPMARAFLATAEQVFRDHQSDPSFDFTPVIVEFSKALEVQANAVLRRALRSAPPDARRLNVEGRTVDVIADGPLAPAELRRFLGEEPVARFLRTYLENGTWFVGPFPALLGDFAASRNPAAHAARLSRDQATAWRNRLLGVGCQGEIVNLARVRLKTEPAEFVRA